MDTFLSKAIVDTMVVKPPQVASIEHAQLEEANGRTRTPFFKRSISGAVSNHVKICL